MNAEDVKRVLAIGAGTMGHQIGLLCAMAGLEVVIYDVAPDVLDEARRRIDHLADRLIGKKRLSHEDKGPVLSRITFTDNARKAASDIDIVTESVPEDPELKGTILGQFNRLCPQRTIFTTNTSSLVPSMFADATGRPDRFLAFHFHDILLTDVVDIMPHPETSESTLELVRGFAERLDQTAIILERENYGYVFNAMLSELFRAATTLASTKVASVEDIDRAWMGVLKVPMGPFGMMDSVGLDTVWKIYDHWAGKTGDPQQKANAAFLKASVDEGRLGMKSGEGFYTYPSPRFQQPDFLKRQG